MLYVSECKTKFITSTADGAPCFTRGVHEKLAKEQGLDLHAMENITVHYFYKGKGKSFRDFLTSWPEIS